VIFRRYLSLCFALACAAPALEAQPAPRPPGLGPTATRLAEHLIAAGVIRGVEPFSRPLELRSIVAALDAVDPSQLAPGLAAATVRLGEAARPPLAQSLWLSAHAGVQTATGPRRQFLLDDPSRSGAWPVGGIDAVGTWGVVTAGRLRAQTTPESAHVFVIAVPTPFKGDHEPDLAYVEAASRAIAPFVREGNLVVLESTVPPGTTERMVRWILDERPDLAQASGRGASFMAAHCPERVLPGRILTELVENDRLVGGVDDESTEVARRFYQTFVRGECVATTARTAELAKLSENAFRDVNIAFANELSIIAARLGVDVWELISLANRHPRVNILQPGPGVGGHCIAVDPWFIVHAAPNESELIRAARAANLRKTDWTVARAKEMAENLGPDAKVFCLGLAYKADVDDLRESPAVEVTLRLARTLENRVFAVEPNIDECPDELLDAGVELRTLDEATNEADLVVLLVDHREFKLDSTALPDTARVLDTRGVIAS